MENYCPEVNSRPRLNFTKGAIISYHSPNKRAVTICFIHPTHRFLIIPNRQIWKGGYRVQNSAVVTTSSRVREIVKTNTYGLVSRREH